MNPANVDAARAPVARSQTGAGDPAAVILEIRPRYLLAAEKCLCGSSSQSASLAGQLRTDLLAPAIQEKNRAAISLAVKRVAQRNQERFLVLRS